MRTTECADPAEPSDAEYVVSSRNGCPDHFGVLVERYQRALLAFLAGRLSSRDQAVEAAQESFVRAFVSLGKLRKPESFYSWLLGIAGRVLKEQYREFERQRQDREAASESLAPEAPGAATADDYPLEEALAALPETYRQVVVLRYYQGMSCQDISVHLRMPLGTVTKTLSRAYAMLREVLRQREHERERHELAL